MFITRQLARQCWKPTQQNPVKMASGTIKNPTIVNVINKLPSQGVIVNPSLSVILSEAKNLPTLLRVNSVKQSHEIATSLRSSQ